MSAIYLMLPFALLLGGGFLAAFIRSARQGQYDDLETPAHRMLLEDEVLKGSLSTNFGSSEFEKGNL